MNSDAGEPDTVAEGEAILLATGAGDVGTAARWRASPSATDYVNVVTVKSERVGMVRMHSFLATGANEREHGS